MITASGGDMEGAAHLFILNVASAHREELGAEAEFSKLARDGIGDQLGIVGCHCPGVALDEFGLYDPASGHGHLAKSSILILELEFSLGPLGHKLDLSCGKIGNIRFIAKTETMAFLGLLTIQDQTQCAGFALAEKIDLHPVCPGDTQP